MTDPLTLHLYAPNKRRVNELKMLSSGISTVKSYHFNRAGLDVLKNMHDEPLMHSPGIYFLFTPHNIDGLEFEDGSLVRRVYIGKSINGIARPVNHATGKDFWSEAVLVVNTSGHWNHDTINELEAYFINYFKRTGYVLENKTVSMQPRAHSRHEKVEFDAYVEDIITHLQTMGYEVFQTPEAPVHTALAVNDPARTLDTDGSTTYTYKGKTARLADTPDGMRLLAGSVVRYPVKGIDNLTGADAAMLPKYHQFIQGLIENGTAVPSTLEPGAYDLTADTPVSSMSFAGALVIGRRIGKEPWVIA